MSDEARLEDAFETLLQIGGEGTKVALTGCMGRGGHLRLMLALASATHGNAVASGASIRECVLKMCDKLENAVDSKDDPGRTSVCH